LNLAQKFFANWMGIDPITVDYNTFDIKDVSPEAFFTDISDNSKKFKAVFSNPACLKVIKLQCDLFSLGEVSVYQGDKIVPDDPFLARLRNPNPLQSSRQWLWDFMFWNMFGNNYLYLDSNIADNERNKMYWLIPEKIEWPKDIEAKRDKLIFSEQGKNDILNTQLKYRYKDGSAISFPYSKLIAITDLSNGQGDWFKGRSALDALYKVISNSEASLDAKNINTRYSGKFLVAGQADPDNVAHLPLSTKEKEDIETKINGRKQVHATKSMIDIKRFVENLANLKLDDSYLADYFVIGNMFNIPKDVLEASLKGTTYENQEKSTMRHVSYTLQPKGNELFGAIANKLGYTEQGKSIVMDWGHLPFMQVFEKERAETESTKISTFANLLKLGVSLEEANAYLDLNFKSGKAESNTGTNSQGQNGES